MKRGELKRKTRLVARSQLKRGKPMARQRMKRTPAKLDNEFPDTVKAAVRRRSGNRCEMASAVCTGTIEHFHHRKLRSQGGGPEITNALGACNSCHAYAHNNRTLAFLMGWCVRSTSDPAKVPVRKGEAA